MKKLLFIYNPQAGKARIRTKLSDIIKIFVQNEYEVTVYPTRGKQNALELTEQKAEQYDMVVCSGGDGTLDEVISGIMKCEKKVPVGYIPAGSTNDFANSLEISKNMIRAAEDTMNGYEFFCDAGQFNDDTFVYIAAFGMFTDVSYMTKQEIKNVIGHAAYLLEGVKRLHTMRTFSFQIFYEDKMLQEELIFGMVTNSKSVGGFRNLIGNSVQLDDGMFEVTLVKKPKNPIAFQEMVAALILEGGESRDIITFKTNHITFVSEEEIPWTLDGEYGGIHTEVVIKNKQKGFRIMVPSDKK